MAIKKIRSSVMTIAHQIRNYFNTWSQALKAAWLLVKLRMGQIITIQFAKSTGEIRTAEVVAVGSFSTIEKGFIRFVELVEEGSQWRSFRIERLLLA